MIFFLDENFPKSAGIYLESLGHQILDIRSTEQKGLNDKKIFELSQKHNAIFLTTDRDFFHTIPY
jgi:predicted nuclease of predicted toxin-antitoxin system